MFDRSQSSENRVRARRVKPSNADMACWLGQDIFRRRAAEGRCHFGVDEV